MTNFRPTDVDKAFISQRKVKSFTRAESFRAIVIKCRPFSNRPLGCHSLRHSGTRRGIIGPTIRPAIDGSPPRDLTFAVGNRGIESSNFLQEFRVISGRIGGLTCKPSA